MAVSVIRGLFLSVLVIRARLQFGVHIIRTPKFWKLPYWDPNIRNLRNTVRTGYEYSYLGPCIPTILVGTPLVYLWQRSSAAINAIGRSGVVNSSKRQPT